MKKKMRKSEIILLRLADDQIKWVKETAKTEGKTVSAFLRGLVQEHKKESIAEMENKIIAKHKKVLEELIELGEIKS